jgi:hypothetical protein
MAITHPYHRPISKLLNGLLQFESFALEGPPRFGRDLTDTGVT